MPHPHWPISPSAFGEKTTKAKGGYTVSLSNNVLKAFYQLHCTISSVGNLRWQMRFPDAFHTAAKKGGWGVKKRTPHLHPFCHAPVRFGAQNGGYPGKQSTPEGRRKHRPAFQALMYPGYFNRILIATLCSLN